MNDKVPFSEKTLTVTEINTQIAACFDSPLFANLEVFGEISGFKQTGAHAYFVLKDKTSQMSCACFNCARTYRPKDGESVVVRGSLDYYVKGGRLSLIAREIVPVGQGLLFLQFERLKAKLEAEGLFAQEHKKPIPQYPQNVLVITSKTGAVIRDIVTTVRRKNPVINLIVKDVRVQGDGAACEICAALEKADRLGYDVIVLARGGGSLEDLAPFYDEKLARVIYNLNTPVISAVGHETDFSLADFAADFRAATPTAAGEKVAYDYYALVQSVNDFSRRMSALTLRMFERKAMRAKLDAQRLKSIASSFYSVRENAVKTRMLKMKSAVLRKTDLSTLRFEHAVDNLDKLSPLKILGRGFFKISSANKSVISVRQLSVGDNITAAGADGELTAQVREISLKNENA
jgi:exodeoxyribonuclease VII large subunit